MAEEKSLQTEIREYDDLIKEAKIQQQLLLKKAYNSDRPGDILYADKIVSGLAKEKMGKQKSYLFDPLQINNNLGYKDRPSSVTYTTLRTMARTPIVKSIITTRTEQIAAFSEAQDDFGKVGWTIRKKRKLFQSRDEQLTDADKFEIEGIVKFIENCGNNEKIYHGSGFNKFLRQIVPDSLILDQSIFEVVPDRLLRPTEFFATDGATFRLAQSYQNVNIKEGQQEINGYYPYYVQLYNGLVHNEYYPWELSFGTRNPTTSIFNYGYGESELEVLIKTVTWMLYADEYNGRFFSQGSNPKGLLALQGNVDEDKLEEFKTQWRQQVAGIAGAWKIPVIQGDQINWIDMQKSNADMEFSIWQQYLIKIICAIYKIAPEEIGFHISNNQGGGTNYEGNQEYKLLYSQDKGLKPLLKFLQDEMNKMVVYPLTKYKYEFVFTGIGIDEDDKELDNDIKKLGSFMGLKELRRKRNLPDTIDKDDVILNPAWIQWKASQQAGNPFSNAAVGNDGGGNDGESDNDGGLGSTMNLKDNIFAFDQYPKSNSVSDTLGEDNPFMKDLFTFMNKEMLMK
jgi:hypothetical protein